MKTQTLSIDVGTSRSAGSFVKSALLCLTGSFDGMNGPVTVTRDMLEKLRDTYLAKRAQPTNDNDYAPILLNHDRDVQLIKGRLLTEGLEVRPWKEVEGVMQFGLFGQLRVDDHEAQKNVEDGKFAHLSISFDEDSWEIFEVSFVAVEAARGSIVLKHGGEKSMELEKKFSTLSQKHTALAALTKESRKKRKAELSKLSATATALSTELGALMKKSTEIRLSVKASQIKGKFVEFVRGGKINPVELKTMDFNELAQMSEAHLKIVLAGYEQRAVMADVLQYGQTGSEVNLSKKLTPESMREAMKLQREGKNSVILAEGEEKPQEDDKEKMSAEEDDKEKSMKMYSMDEEAWAKCMEEISGVHEKLAGVVDKIKAMGEDTDKLAEGDKEDEKKEMAIEEDKEGVK